MKIFNFLRNNFRAGEPLFHFCHPKWFNRVANILQGIEGVGCDIVKPQNAEGRGWKIVVQNPAYSDAYQWQGLPTDTSVHVRVGSWYRNGAALSLAPDTGQTYKSMDVADGNYVWAAVDSSFSSVTIANGPSYTDADNKWLIGHKTASGAWVQDWRGGMIDEYLLTPDYQSLEKDDNNDTGGDPYTLQFYGWDSPSVFSPSDLDLFPVKEVASEKLRYTSWQSIKDLADSRTENYFTSDTNWVGSPGDRRYWVQGDNKATCYGQNIGDAAEIRVIDLTSRRLTSGESVENLDWYKCLLMVGDSGDIALDWDSRELKGSWGWGVTSTTEATLGDTSGAAAFRVAGGIRAQKMIVGSELWITDGAHGVNAGGDLYVRDAYLDSGQSYCVGSNQGYTDTATVFVISTDTGGSNSFNIIGGLLCAV